MNFRNLAGLYVLALTAVLSSCGTGADDDPYAFRVTYADFENAVTAEGFAEPVNSTTILCAPFLDGTVVSIADDGVIVSEGDVVCVIEDPNLGNDYDNTLKALHDAEVNLNKTQADLEMQYAILAAQVETNEADTKIAQMDSLQLLYATPNQRRITELQLQSTAITKAKFDKKLEALAVIQRSEIRRWELEIKRLRDQVASMEERLATLTVKAPKTGLFVRAVSWMTGEKLKVGDPLWENMPIATIPEMERMKVMMQLSEREFKQISVGDSVTYTFDAMPGNAGWGRITAKSPVGQPRKRDSKVKFFEIEASIDSVAEMPDPGFTADCRIITQRLADTLVVPQIAVFEQYSTKVVFLKGRRGYEMREVATGPSSLYQTVIVAGIAPGEVVSLTRPKPSLVRTRTRLPRRSRPRSPETDSLFKYIALWDFKQAAPSGALPPFL